MAQDGEHLRVIDPPGVVGLRRLSARRAPRPVHAGSGNAASARRRPRWASRAPTGAAVRRSTRRRGMWNASPWQEPPDSSANTPGRSGRAAVDARAHLQGAVVAVTLASRCSGIEPGRQISDAVSEDPGRRAPPSACAWGPANSPDRDATMRRPLPFPVSLAPFPISSILVAVGIGDERDHRRAALHRPGLAYRRCRRPPDPGARGGGVRHLEAPGARTRSRVRSGRRRGCRSARFPAYWLRARSQRRPASTSAQDVPVIAQQLHASMGVEVDRPLKVADAKHREESLKSPLGRGVSEETGRRWRERTACRRGRPAGPCRPHAATIVDDAPSARTSGTRRSAGARS